MCSCNQSQAVVVIECLRNILSKCVARTTGRNAPTTSVIGITPEQIAHGPLVGNFLEPVERANVVERVDRRTETTMQTEDLIFDQGSKGQVIEQVGKIFPDVRVAVLSQTLVVEAIHLCDLAGFVVATQDRNAPRVADFESDKESNSLDGVVATVNVVP
jgi:hypothetical protein